MQVARQQQSQQALLLIVFTSFTVGVLVGTILGWKLRISIVKWVKD